MNDRYTKICEMRMTVEPSPAKSSNYDLKVDGFFVARTFAGYPGETEFKHAQRMTACWNACIGMSNYVLSVGAKPFSELGYRAERAVRLLEEAATGNEIVRNSSGVAEAIELLRGLGQ